MTEIAENTSGKRRLKKVKGNSARFFGLVKKNLRISVRDKGNYFWILGYPVLLILIFTLAFSNIGSGEGTTYSVVIINEDTDGATNDLEQIVSITFVNLFNSSDPDNHFAQTFQRKTTFKNGTIITKADALALVNKGAIDAVVIIPKDFSEVVIGGTWWYKLMKSPEFQSMSAEDKEKLQQGFPPAWLYAINSTDFTSNGTPALEIHCVPDITIKTVINNVFNGIMNDIVLGFNDVSPVNTEMIDATAVESLTMFDWVSPGMVIAGVTVAIMMIALYFGTEKERGLLRRLDTTPVPRSTQLLAGGFAQIIGSSIQVIIIMIMLVLLGVKTAPDCNWALAFLNALIMAFPCIGIGLLIAAFVRSGSEAGGLSWIAILPLQFFGGVFFDVGDNIFSKLIPTYYGTRAMRNIMIYGAGFGDVWLDMVINVLFGIGFIVIGLVVFNKRTQT